MLFSVPFWKVLEQYKNSWCLPCKCKYLIIHSPQGFSGIIYNTGWGTLPDCLRCSLQVMKEWNDAPIHECESLHKKGFGICATRKKFFRGASSPVIVQRVTKRAIKLKTRLPNGQLTQILKCHQQLPKRLEKCWRTKLLSEKPIAIRFALHFCRILSLKLCGNYPRKATVFLNNKKRNMVVSEDHIFYTQYFNIVCYMIQEITQAKTARFSL